MCVCVCVCVCGGVGGWVGVIARCSMLDAVHLVHTAWPCNF